MSLHVSHAVFYLVFAVMQLCSSARARKAAQCSVPLCCLDQALEHGARAAARSESNAALESDSSICCMR